MHHNNYHINPHRQVQLPNDGGPSSRELLTSTIIALGVATALLVTVVLPAEYAIDPTGIGRLLGLTRMGEIKVQLAEEAKAAELAAAQLTETLDAADESGTSPNPAVRSDGSETVETTIAPDQGIEIKVRMDKGMTIDYAWKAEGGNLNYDMHGEATTGRGGSQYDKGTDEADRSGTLTAAFDGTHGWFWRNRSGREVTLRLEVRGEFIEVKEI
jgi:hypothetical protein